MRTEGYVYFIQGGGEEGLIKIGWAINPVKRLRDLQIGSPVPLSILGVKPGTAKDEGKLHRQLAFARFHGEWFAPVPEVLDEVPDHIPEGAYSVISYPGSFDPETWKTFQKGIEARKPSTSPSFFSRDEKTKREVQKFIDVLGLDFEPPSSGCSHPPTHVHVHRWCSLCGSFSLSSDTWKRPKNGDDD